jgi:ubiquinone/menaquinone biosynthesis C-methylase UbiE
VREVQVLENDSIERAVQRGYDLQSEREWKRMDRHRTEFAVTLRAMKEHLPPPPARILDCGGGPGRYAIKLAEWGYEVVLFDLSPGNLQLAREKAKEAGVMLAGYEQGTATDLAHFSDESFDAVLLMGPLYHILDEAARKQALAEAYRVVRVGGLFFAAFITRYAVPRYAAANEPRWIVENPESLEEILRTGNLPPQGLSETEFVAHFAHPKEVEPLCRGAGFEVVTVLGVEGLVSLHEEGVNELSGFAWEAWLDLNYRVAPDPTIHGCTEHLLLIGNKPRWRAVLRLIAQGLAEAGVTYTVVGGTSPALHGIPIPVKDLDIETTAEDAYRFRDLYTEQVVTWKGLSEGATYRSHFGQFDFDGVSVEVMGDLHRREGDAWVPSSATTETIVDLDGVPVRVSWLEEETLAYLRRGRLERAALCLPHCDADRLGRLLRGEQSTGVL